MPQPAHPALTLKIGQRASRGGNRTVELVLEGDGAPQTAVAHFAYTVTVEDREAIRWYLEDYLEYPADPAATIAAAAETRIRQTGTGLFAAIFDNNADTIHLWGRVRDRLAGTRIEITVETGETPLPYELLHDPHTNTHLALGAAAFVHTHHNPTRRPAIPALGAGERLRVLLVISRPARGDDVPFRSVAAHLARHVSSTHLDLDVLRPPTWTNLNDTLHRAHQAGTPYHIVHFDGHGTYTNLTDDNYDQGEGEGDGDGDDDGEGGDNQGGDNPGGGPGTRAAGQSRPPVQPLNPNLYRTTTSTPRPGRHGYLLFENPADTANTTYVDGPALGNLLADTAVPVLVLNACRSAHAEAPATPDANVDQDVHARIRAYGSLAHEIADTGAAGVVAMAYNVYVVTAAAFIAQLYTHLLGGQTLGAAVTAARRHLVADPMRTIAYQPRALQDWVVPVAYETVPLTLLPPPDTGTPAITVDQGGATAAGLPAAPDAGFYGRHDTLLALDRTYDTQPIVVLHALAGAGKTATAAEFAHWYATTGGTQSVLWTSFEQPVTLPRLLDQLADHHGPVLAAHNIAWQALNENQRRDVALQLLRAVPLLWVWDNTELVAGFPPGTPSKWTPQEQSQLKDFLAELRDTGSKVLVTSRHPEQAWLGGLPARVPLHPMPMRESVQLAAAIAQKHGARIDQVEDWRPLLTYAAGNPLTITLLVNQALRQHLTTREDIQAFVARLRDGEDLDDTDTADDTSQGRSASLGASLRYGYTTAFTAGEQQQICLLALYQGFAQTPVLALMGNPDLPEHLPQLAGTTADTWDNLLARAAATGLVTQAGGGYYRLHPALPWFLTPTLHQTWGQPASPGHTAVLAAYSAALSDLGNYYLDAYSDGDNRVIPVLAAEEANLLHGRRLALAHHWWHPLIGHMQGLDILYTHQGRNREWARLVTDTIPLYTDPATGGPLPGRQPQWSITAHYQVRLAREARDWARAEQLQQTVIEVARQSAQDALAADPDTLTAGQRRNIRSLSVAIDALADILRGQGRADCVTHYQQAIDLARRAGDANAEAVDCYNLGLAYKDLPELRDLDQSQHWLQASLDLRHPDDHIRRARSINALGSVALQRFYDARRDGAPDPVLLGYLNEAANLYHHALTLTPPDAVADLAATHNQLGNIYRQAGDTTTALHHYQQSIRHQEAAGDRHGAGSTRYNIALLFAGDQPRDALLYAQTALTDFETYGPGAQQDIDKTRTLITRLLEQTSANPPSNK
jgi:tetratricopeptide (TPR) repeat protein